MSLNKFTATQKGIDLSLKIGCEELRALTLNVDNLTVENLAATVITTNILNVETIEAINIDASNNITSNSLSVVDITATNSISSNVLSSDSLIVGDLSYPATETANLEYQYPTSDGTGTLQMLPSLPWLSYGFVRSSSAGAGVTITNYNTWTQSDTNTNLSSLPSAFYLEHPKGCTIQKDGLYRVVGSVRAIRALADPTTYCSVLVNGSAGEDSLQSVSTSANNTDMAANLTRYLSLSIGDIISMGLAGTTGGNLIWEYWRLDLEYIK
jgi:hypothetical protein